jgi:uncharacterized membrane protein YphA (DoxX/SURF4 family)
MMIDYNPAIGQRTIHGDVVMPNWLRRIMATEPVASYVLIRLMVGAVFLSEGVQKFLYPAMRGGGRFEKIGLPSPEFLGHFVGAFETLCGALILLGLFTRLAVIPTITIMCVALVTTKLPMLADTTIEHDIYGGGPWYRFWHMAHAMRTDWAMLLGSLFLLIVGGGRWSVDVVWSSRKDG